MEGVNIERMQRAMTDMANGELGEDKPKFGAGRNYKFTQWRREFEVTSLSMRELAVRLMFVISCKTLQVRIPLAEGHGKHDVHVDIKTKILRVSVGGTTVLEDEFYGAVRSGECVWQIEEVRCKCSVRVSCAALRSRPASRADGVHPQRASHDIKARGVPHTTH